MFHSQGNGQFAGGAGMGPVDEKREIDLSIKEGVSEFEKENDYIQFFKYIQGHHSCTHSSMIGPSDHRIPRSGKFDVSKKEALTKLNSAISFFYRQGKPLVLCEIATSRFRFFEDVDLLLPIDMKDQVNLQQLQKQWVELLLAHRAAVLGAVWRSDDPLGIHRRSDKATVHVFTSTGFSEKHGKPKISLHFVWPDLIVTPREAKGIRSATIEFLRESCSNQLSTLLDTCYSKNELVADFDMSPWEEIFDKAATEGTSLRLVFCDKGVKADLEKKTAAKLEGRPKVPIGTYEVPLEFPGEPENSMPVLVCPPEGKSDVAWLGDASIRLDGADMPRVSNVWLSASQTKGLAGIKVGNPGVMNLVGGNIGNNLNANDPNLAQMPIKAGDQSLANGGDAFSIIKRELLGMKVDQNANWMDVVEYPSIEGREQHKLRVLLGDQQIAELVISENVYSMPIDIDYVAMDGTNNLFTMHFQPGTDKYGTWFPRSAETQESWMWRKPAVPLPNHDWPAWAEFVLIEIAGAADPGEKTMGLSAIICAVSNVPTSGAVHGEKYWEGHMSFGPKDFGEEYQVNVPLATLASLIFGLKAVLDLREKIGGPKIKGIFISSDHTVVESVIDGQSTASYLEPIANLLRAYKQEILDDQAFPNCFNFAVSKISASANKAAKLAKEARQLANDDEFPGCSMGDIELCDAVISACESAAKK